jgi:hypothetical protein
MDALTLALASISPETKHFHTLVDMKGGGGG